MHDQAEKLRQMVQGGASQSRRTIIKEFENRARVITVTSGKGGVGKTNLTVNLALALANLGQRVLIIDADLGLANVDVLLGSTPPRNLMHLIEGGGRLGDIVADGPRGIKFMSGGSGIYQLANLNEAQLSHIITQITLFDRWANIILIDTGAGLTKTVLNFVVAADEVIIITTPEPTAITDAYAMMKAYAGQHGRAPLKVVINRVADTEEGQAVVDKLIKVAFRFLGLPVSSLGFVYEDRNVQRAVKDQTPLMLSYPDTISARCIDNIAHRLLYGEDIPQPRGIRGFFSKFRQMW